MIFIAPQSLITSISSIGTRLSTMAKTGNLYPSSLSQLIFSPYGSMNFSRAVPPRNFIAETTFSSTSLRVNHCTRQQFCHLLFDCLHIICNNRLISGSHKQTGLQTTIGVGGICNDYFIHCFIYKSELFNAQCAVSVVLSYFSGAKYLFYRIVLKSKVIMYSRIYCSDKNGKQCNYFGFQQ